MKLPGRRTGPPPGTGLAPIYVRYLSLRLLIFLGVLLICIALSLRGIAAVVVALLVSGVLSYPLARKQRESIVREIHNRRK
ncbi:MAG TPA: DUF4229 domain-containing protein [Frankiaceae bacterium]|nr:DUF4229 domain-containing protein [Frankiaceae bacterium]